MDRPQSIVWFERLYLGGVAIGLANTLINWSSMQEQIAATPNSEMLPDWFFGVTMALGIGINLLLWYFVARRGAVVAKWIVTIFFALGLIGILRTLGSDMAPGTTAIAIAVLVVQAGAVFMLFRPNTKAWFGGGAAS